MTWGILLVVVSYFIICREKKIGPNNILEYLSKKNESNG